MDITLMKDIKVMKPVKWFSLTTVAVLFNFRFMANTATDYLTTLRDEANIPWICLAAFF